jgi:PAS domain-containing protein
MLNLTGNIEKWYGTSTDIHDQKTVHEVLHLAEERFNLVAKATQDVIWDWNLVTDSIWWNEGFQTQFGYGIDDIEPDVSSWFNRVHPEDKDRVVGGIDKVIHNGGKPVGR